MFNKCKKLLFHLEDMLEYSKPLIPSGLVYFLVNCNFIILSSKNQLNNQKNNNILKFLLGGSSL